MALQDDIHQALKREPELMSAAFDAKRAIIARELTLQGVKRFPLRPDLAVTFSWAACGVGYRESHWGPQLEKDGTGDNGNGIDEMQVDKNQQPAAAARIIAAGVYGSEARLVQAIEEGCTILHDYMRQFDPAWRTRGGLAAYNCGVDRAKAGIARGRPNYDPPIPVGSPDAYTTGRNYGAWILGYTDKWRRMSGSLRALDTEW